MLLKSLDKMVIFQTLKIMSWHGMAIALKRHWHYNCIAILFFIHPYLTIDAQQNNTG